MEGSGTGGVATGGQGSPGDQSGEQPGEVADLETRTKNRTDTRIGCESGIRAGIQMEVQPDLGGHPDQAEDRPRVVTAAGVVREERAPRAPWRSFLAALIAGIGAAILADAMVRPRDLPQNDVGGTESGRLGLLTVPAGLALKPAQMDGREDDPHEDSTDRGDPFVRPASVVLPASVGEQVLPEVFVPVPKAVIGSPEHDGVAP